MPVSEYTPAATDVAAYLRARTKTRGGKEAGTFNSETVIDSDRTRPTSEQVDVEIGNALGDITAVIGEDIPALYFQPARRVSALRTALLIELTYFPEQVATGRSPYAQLKELYDEAWENLLTGMGISVDQGGGAVSVDAGFPSYGGFPTTAIGMEHPW